MRFIYLLVATLIISSCGGGGSSTEIILDAEENSAEPCQSYVSSNGSGKTFNCSVIHDEKNRQFFIYQGSTYSGDAPILFVLHGYTSRALWIMNYSGFQSIADEFGFLVIYPQGTLLPSTGQTHWNVGGWTTSSTTDDVSFINSLINFIDDEYSIDLKRIYSTGMSNGGYMSYKLACDLSSKIAAVVSVTGSMTNETKDGCNPTHPTSVAQIHGLQDTVVNYDGNGFSKPIEDVMDYWVDINNCTLEPDTSEISGNNGGGIHDVYSGCDNQTNVELYLMTNMGHNWPNQNNHDLQASTTVWNFLSKYDIDGLIE
tara:strand:- start:1205 stop:2146 length:942 start_codon:yes stop_codon:yes gene_type:complete